MLGINKAKTIAQAVFKLSQVKWSTSVERVFDISLMAERSPTFKVQNTSPDAVIQRWCTNYINGYNNRPSQNLSLATKTKCDPAILKMLSHAMSGASESALLNMIAHHNVLMACENNMGALLEEYIADNLSDKGWHCAWGSVVKSVDFVGPKGELLQIKSRNNTENSSSNKVRESSDIIKWWRFHSGQGTTNWEALNKITGQNALSEKGFTEFIEKVTAQHKRQGSINIPFESATLL